MYSRIDTIASIFFLHPIYLTRPYSLSLSLCTIGINSRNSDPGSHSRLSPSHHLVRFVPCFYRENTPVLSSLVDLRRIVQVHAIFFYTRYFYSTPDDGFVQRNILSK